jgi:hypothetical protein
MPVRSIVKNFVTRLSKSNTKSPCNNSFLRVVIPDKRSAAKRRSGTSSGLTLKGPKFPALGCAARHCGGDDDPRRKWVISSGFRYNARLTARLMYFQDLDPTRTRWRSSLERAIKEMCETLLRYGYRSVHVMVSQAGLQLKTPRRLSTKSKAT